MREKINYYWQQLRVGILQSTRRYPVELLLIGCSCIGCLVAYEMEGPSAWTLHLSLLPLFASLALAVNHLVGMGPWRKVYRVCWIPIVPLLFWPGFMDWLDSPSAVITFMALVPLVLLLCRRAVQNHRFVCDALVWLRSAVLAGIFANVALGLFCSILYSTTYIFGLEGGWIDHVVVYAVIFAETLFVPVLFLVLSDRWAGTDCKGSRILDVLVNYIITPALLVYTVILYLYMVKILVSWELPRGGVAYLVFGFTLAALGVQALQLILQKRIYNWFFDRFSLVALPTQVLFWAGVMHRVSEYGVTTSRVYLLVCGGLMTLCVAFFLSRKLGRYFWVGLVAWIVFALMAYVPGLSSERVATCLQAQRAERIATRLNMLSEDGALRFGDLAGADSLKCVELHNLYEALDYIERRDPVAFYRFGLEQMSDFSDRLPGAIKNQVIGGGDDSRFQQDQDDAESISISSSKGFTTDIGPYKVMYTDFSYWDTDALNYSFENDTLRIGLGKDRPTLTVSGRELLCVQLRKIGAKNDHPETDLLDKHAEEMLNYSDDKAMILFSNMSLTRRDSTLQIDEVVVNAVLMR